MGDSEDDATSYSVDGEFEEDGLIEIGAQMEKIKQKDIMQKQYLNPAAWGQAVNLVNMKWLHIMSQKRFQHIDLDLRHVTPYGDEDLYYAAVNREFNLNQEMLERKQQEYKEINAMIEKEEKIEEEDIYS